MIRVLSSFISNLATLLLSFFLAFIIWITATQARDPIISRSLQIPLEFTGQPGNTTLVEPRNPSQGVIVGFEGRASLVNQLTVENFSAVADLSQAPPGIDTVVPIQLRQRESQVRILSQFPEQIMVHLEELVTRDIPVELEIRGSVARGHSRGEPLVDPDVITVIGTASEVEILDFALVTVFLNNDRETKIESPQPIFYDRQGRVASVRNLDLSPREVQVTIPINESADFAEKFITVNLRGQPAPGYRLLSVSVNPSSVLLQGRPTQLNLLHQVRTEPIDITGLTGTFVTPVTLDLPSGISLDEVAEIVVTVEIEPFSSVATYSRAIEIQGLGEMLEAEVTPNEVRIVLFGPTPVLDALSGEEVQVAVDLFGLPVGIHSLEPVVSFPDRGIELRSVQPSLVTVRITPAVIPTQETAELP